MQLTMMKTTKIWLLWAVLMIGLCYSAFVLTSKPLYAQSGCTAAKCATAKNQLTLYCSSRGGLVSFVCPIGPRQYFYQCGNGTKGLGYCN